MNLIFFPPLGGSLQNLASRGELERFENNYIRAYRKKFSNLLYVSYNPSDSIIPGLTVLLNKPKLHRYLWQIIAPFKYQNEFKNSICRVMQLDGLLPAVLAKLFFGSKVVVTYGYDYSNFAKIEKKYVQSILYFLFETILLPLSDLIIVPSLEVFESMRNSRFLAKKVVNIPNGVDTNLFSIPKHKIKFSKTRLLSVGRLEKQKNYPFMIRSLGKDTTLSDKYCLTIVGEGSDKSKIEDLCRSFNVSLVSITKLQHTKLPSQYQNCDVYIQPSIIEGSPKTLLEAMSCGCCVMASNVSGNREIIIDGKNGFLFELNEKSLLEKFRLVVADKNVQEEVGNEARKTILKKYNLKDNLMHETKLIEALL